MRTCRPEPAHTPGVAARMASIAHVLQKLTLVVVLRCCLPVQERSDRTEQRRLRGNLGRTRTCRRLGMLTDFGMP